MITRKFLLQELRDMLILVTLGILMTWTGLACRDCFSDTRGFWIIASFTGLMWVLLWKGNSYLSDYLSLKISWLKYPMQRFFTGLVVTIVYTVMVMFLMGALYRWSFDVRLIEGAYVSVIITIIISLFMHGRAFLINWKQTSVNAEMLEKENITARYESLKNQVNPHFLFNSLNALTNLVYEDQDKAVKFIKQLSEVYRYVLDTRDKEVVDIEEELKFLDSYLFLQKIRFGEKLKIHLEIPRDTGLKVAPLALQMLIENAIKHNVISEDNPLTVRIYKQDGYIIVENTLRKKGFSAEPSSGIGLENICKRYEFLTTPKVIVSQDEQHFKVKLPVLR